MDETEAVGAGGRGPSDEEVRRTVISPLYRTTPHRSAEAEASEGSGSGDGAPPPLRVLVLGEANICRSPVAEAFLRAEFVALGLEATISCASKAVHDYALGEGVPIGVREACVAAGLPEPAPGHKARKWSPEWDVCDFDLLVAVDRYVAADALKEVAVWDTIQKDVEYTSRIRGLYEFGTPPEEIEDPLYGNVGGQEEAAAVRRSLEALRNTASGLAATLATALDKVSITGLEERPEALREALAAMLEGMGAFEWDAPPMLSKRKPGGSLEVSDDGLLSIGADL